MLFMHTARHAPELLTGQELRAAGADGLVAEYAEARALVRRGAEETAGGEGELLARIGKGGGGGGSGSDESSEGGGEIEIRAAVRRSGGARGAGADSGEEGRTLDLVDAHGVPTGFKIYQVQLLRPPQVLTDER